MSLENRHKLTSNYHGSNQNKFFVSTLFLIFMERSISIVFCNLSNGFSLRIFVIFSRKNRICLRQSVRDYKMDY